MNHRPTNHQLTCLSAVKAMFLALLAFGLWGMGQEARAQMWYRYYDYLENGSYGPAYTPDFSVVHQRALQNSWSSLAQTYATLPDNGCPVPVGAIYEGGAQKVFCGGGYEVLLEARLPVKAGSEVFSFTCTPSGEYCTPESKSFAFDGLRFISDEYGQSISWRGVLGIASKISYPNGVVGYGYSGVSFASSAPGYGLDASADIVYTDDCDPNFPGCEIRKNMGDRCGADAVQGLPSCGNPINPATGGKFQQETDWVGSGDFPLSFSRAYNHMPAKTHTGQIQVLTHPFDRHPYAAQIIKTTQSATGGVKLADIYTLDRGDGQSFSITEWVGGELMKQNDVRGALIVMPSGDLQYVNSMGVVETYTPFTNNTYRLSEIKNLQGLTHRLTYDDANRKITVTHSSGQSMMIQKNAAGGLSTFTTPEGKVYSYTYTNGNLTQIKYPDNKVRTYIYDQNRLTGIVDENNQRFATWVYDPVTLKATSSEHAGGVEKTTVVYSDTGSTITHPLGLVETQSYELLYDAQRASASDRSVGGQNAITYDASGNYASITDWNGNKTCYAHNTRNLRTLQIEGLPSTADCTAMTAANAVLPANTRKTATEYHPSLNLITKLIEPTRTTDIVYDDKAHILSKTITDTSNTNTTDPLRTRVWSYTYTYAAAPSDPIIRKVIEDGPRTDVADTTTYDFDAQGNLTKITNALGEITTYSDYDANGRVGKITDPNGLETTYTYTPRGWLSTQTQGNASVGLRTTTFEYDGVGQLTKATQPDGSFTRYEYDAAHRLVALYDAAGNSIKYTLDAMGNITRQDINDATGNLTQTAAAPMPNASPLPVLAFLDPVQSQCYNNPERQSLRAKALFS